MPVAKRCRPASAPGWSPSCSVTMPRSTKYEPAVTWNSGLLVTTGRPASSALSMTSAAATASPVHSNTTSHRSISSSADRVSAWLSGWSVTSPKGRRVSTLLTVNPCRPWNAMVKCLETNPVPATPTLISAMLPIVLASRGWRSVQYLKFRQRKHKPAAPFPDVAELIHNLFLVIPRENQDEIRAGFSDDLRGNDRQAASGQIFADLVGNFIGHIVDQGLVDAAEIQQRTAFGRRTESRHPLALLSCVGEELQERRLDAEDLGSVAGVTFHAVKPGLFFGLTDAHQAGFLAIGGLIVVADKDTEASSMGRK